MIIYCGCKNEMQDKLHGKGNRVHNKLGKGGEPVKKEAGQKHQFRCTVCKTERSASE